MSGKRAVTFNKLSSLNPLLFKYVPLFIMLPNVCTNLRIRANLSLLRTSLHASKIASEFYRLLTHVMNVRSEFHGWWREVEGGGGRSQDVHWDEECAWCPWGIVPLFRGWCILLWMLRATREKVSIYNITWRWKWGYNKKIKCKAVLYFRFLIFSITSCTLSFHLSKAS